MRRSLLRSPAAAAVVWACTVIWFAVSPAFLSLLGALEWRSLPFAEADRIVWVHGGFDLAPFLATTRRFQSVGSFEEGWLVVQGPRGNATAVGAVVEESFFDTVPLRPIQGRVFTPGRAAAEAGGAVLTRRLCRRLFGREIPPIGAALRVGDRPFALLAVVPDQPVFPPLAQIWVLAASGIRPDSSFSPRGSVDLGMVARLAAGTSVAVATTVTRQVAWDLEKRTNVLQGDVIGVEPLEELLRRRSIGERGILTVALAGLGVFLLLAYTSALAGFVVERRGEMAVRIALGASRLALVRLLVLQAVLVAVPGFVVGLPIAVYVLGKLSQLVPPVLAELIPPRLDAGSLVLAAGIWAAVVLTSALLVWGSAPQIGLTSLLVPDRTEAKRTRPQARVRLGLVCAALSLAVALGATAAVLRESLANRERIPLGFEPRNMASAVVRFAKPLTPEQLPPRLAQLRERLARVAGVAAVSFSDAIPLAAGSGSLQLTSADRSKFWMCQLQATHGDYLRAAGLRLLAGRDLDPLEEEKGAAVALLDQEGARKIFGPQTPLGQTLFFDEEPIEIVGVVPMSKNSAVEESHQPHLYVPLRFRYKERAPEALALLLRLTGPVEEEALVTALEGTGASLSQYRPLPAIVEAALAPGRLARDLATVQWAVTLALAAFATFGTFSWLLDVRAEELAVRLALGGTQGGIAWLILRSALGVTGTAVLTGLVLYLPLGQALRVLLFGVKALNPAALLESILLVGGVALGASGLATALGLRHLSLDLLKRTGQP